MTGFKRWWFVILAAALATGPARADDADLDQGEAAASAEQDEGTSPDTHPDPDSAPASDEAVTAEGPDDDAAAPDRAPAAPAPEPAHRPTDRVRMRLELTGEIFAPAGRDAPPLRLPTALDAMFDFRESMIPGEDDVVERRYADATADLRIDAGTRRIALAPDARVVRFVLEGTTPSPFLVDGFLSREELDLLETPFDPLLAAAVRADRSVAEGETWDLPADVAAGLLAIDTIESGGLEATLAEVVDGRATVAVAGIVDGAADGVPTHVTVEGTFTFPIDTADEGRFTLQRRPEAATAILRERREAGHVAPGFDVEARVSFARTPDADTADRVATDDAPDADLPDRRRGPGRPGLVWHRDALGRFEIVHDSDWRTIEDGVDGLVMRLVDRGALVAQSSVTALPRASAASPPTIAEVERDLAGSLAGQFGAVEHSSEATRSDGVRIVRVIATGRAGDLPFRWIHAVLTDGQGHRLAVTCMLEESMRKRFGEADRDLVDGIVLPGSGGGEPAGPTPAHADREARLPQDSLMP